jgi:phosphatidylglycerophosphatase A
VTGRTLLLTVFGLGYRRPAPGTWGSLPPPVIALVLVSILGSNGLTRSDHWILALVMVAIALVFTWACAAFGDWAEAWWGWKDPSQIVADETAGQAIALIALPWRGTGDKNVVLCNLLLAATAFFAFRFFDIVKPWPARQIQAYPGGWGVVLDDLFAGVYALIVTLLLARFVWGAMM